jgi:hypothetical protein
MCERISLGLRHMEHESWRELFTDSVGHLISFPSPSHTHFFGNHINGYSHSKTANMRSSADCRTTELSVVWTWT